MARTRAESDALAAYMRLNKFMAANDDLLLDADVEAGRMTYRSGRATVTVTVAADDEGTT